MKIYFDGIRTFLLSLSVVLSVSCGLAVPSETDGSVISGDTVNPKAVTEQTPLGQDDRDRAIIETISNFWKLSQSGNDEAVAKYISPAPKEFWKRDNTENEKPTNSVEDRSQGEHFRTGKGGRISASEKEDSFWLLKRFSQQIHAANPELLKTRIVKSNETEAIVKIDWVTPDDKSKGGWLSQGLLLFKSNDGWKIFMLTDPHTLEKYNPSFAQPK